MKQGQDFAVPLLQALEYAADMHRDQRRKNVEASPYINHPIQVAEVLATVGEVDDLETLMAAVLHDTVEDTETTFTDLTEKFGIRVSDLVAEVTDDRSLPKDERKRQQVEHSPTLTDKAKMIKIADKTCNVKDIGSNPPAGWDEERRKQYFEWAEEVVAGCSGVNARLEANFHQCVAESRALLSEKGPDTF